MVEWFLAAPAVYWGYATGARFYLRRLRKRPQAERIGALERWSTHPLSPVRLEARILHAESLRDVNAAQALDVLRPAMEVNGIKAVPALLLAGRWADYDRWHGHAERHYRDAVDRLRGRKHAPLRGRIQRFRAESAFSESRVEEALEFLRLALKENEFDQESRLLHAAAAFGMGKLDEAEDDFAFFEKHFGNAALRTRAVICATHIDVLRGRAGEAQERLQKVARDLAGRDEAIQVRAAIVDAFFGRPAEARERLDRAEVEPQRRTYADGVIAAAEGELESAQRKLSETLMRGAIVDPFSSEALWLLEAVLRKAGRSQQADEMRKRLKERWPLSPYLLSEPPAAPRSSDAASNR